MTMLSMGQSFFLFCFLLYSHLTEKHNCSFTTVLLLSKPNNVGQRMWDKLDLYH